MRDIDCDVLVVGGGVAGLTTGLFTARAGLDTLVVDHGESILRRNAHLENFPGFPAGVNSRLFTELLSEQADRNGVTRRAGAVTDLRRGDDAFVADVRAAPADVAVKTPAVGGDDGDRTPDAADDHGAVTVETRTKTPDTEDATIRADRVVAASWSDASYLDGLDVEMRDAGSKQYLRHDEAGRTSVEGLYAAGRLAEMYHQAVVNAGHGAQVGITLVHDSAVPFYNDWVAPEGYFTDRGREVPPGCEEIDEAERRARERESRETMRAFFADPHDAPQRTHPSLADEE